MTRNELTENSAWKNPVKEKLLKGETVVGPVISVNSVEVATQAAALGFDFIWLEMEHTPLSLEIVRNIVLATRGLPAAGNRVRAEISPGSPAGAPRRPSAAIGV